MLPDTLLIDCNSDTWEGHAIWQDLFAVTPGASAYVSPVVVGEWIQIFAEPLSTKQFVVYQENGKAAGTCLLSKSSKCAGPVHLQRGFLNLDGEPAADSLVVEYNRPLIVPGYEQLFYSALARHLHSVSRIDEFQASGLPDDVVRAIEEHLPSWQVELVQRESPYVDLKNLRVQGIDHLTSISRNTRSQINRCRRLYEEMSAPVLDVATTQSEAGVFFDELLELHAKRWNSVGQKGGFATDRRIALHKRIIQTGLDSGLVQLLRLRAGSRTLGVLYNLVANGQVCFYQSGILREENPQLKPGLLLHHLAIEHYLHSGMHRYDFLPSLPNEGRYKDSLSNMSDTLTTMTCRRPAMRTRYFQALRFMRDALTR